MVIRRACAGLHDSGRMLGRPFSPSDAPVARSEYRGHSHRHRPKQWVRSTSIAFGLPRLVAQRGLLVFGGPCSRRCASKVSTHRPCRHMWGSLYCPFHSTSSSPHTGGVFAFHIPTRDIAWLTNIVFLLTFAMASAASASSSILALLWVAGSDENIYLEIPTVYKILLVILGLFSVHLLIVLVIAGHVYAHFLVFAWAATFAFIWMMIYIYAFRPFVTAPQYKPLSDRRIELPDVAHEFVLFRKLVTLFAMTFFSIFGSCT
jgi:hypothetical protein